MALVADLNRPGAWRSLLASALRLTDHLERVIQNPLWTFGGGTVLMLRLDHRHSKDIDLFVPDPQYLGHVTPRLSDAAEQLTDRYVEAASFVKLLLPGGEIDIVVGESLTGTPWVPVPYGSRILRLETNAEIIAKRLYHRGDHGKARDLFDLCAVIEADPASIDEMAPWFARHGRQFIGSLRVHSAFAAEEFAQIDRLSYRRGFEECLELAEFVIESHLAV